MIKMGFLKHFQEYNQTPENIFQNIFWNATKDLKIFSFPENILHPTKHSLKCIGEMNKQNLKLLKDQTSSNQPKLNQEPQKSQVGI